jgi:hypothetical protein
VSTYVRVGCITLHRPTLEAAAPALYAALAAAYPNEGRTPDPRMAGLPPDPRALAAYAALRAARGECPPPPRGFPFVRTETLVPGRRFTEVVHADVFESRTDGQGPYTSCGACNGNGCDRCMEHPPGGIT